MLLLLLRSPDGPTTQAGVRSLLAFWIGGASITTGAVTRQIRVGHRATLVSYGGLAG